MEKPAIELKDIARVYGEGNRSLRVLDAIDLTVPRGEFFSIVGPSGAGKSTLLNIMGGLDRPTNGSCRVMGRSLTGMTERSLSRFRNQSVGFVFQLHHLLPEFTALENVMMPLLIRRVKPSRARDEALAILEKCGLGERKDHKPGEMSGGECQRTAVARAMAGKPPLILADEPTGSLDSRNSTQLMDLLFAMGKEQSSTVCIVTHDMDLARRTGRIVHLVDGLIVKDERLRKLD